MEIKDFLNINLDLIDGLGNEFTACKSRWCQRERWHHLLYVTHIAIL